MYAPIELNKTFKIEFELRRVDSNFKPYNTLAKQQDNQTQLRTMAHQSQIIAESTRKPIINKFKPPHTFKSNYKLPCACCDEPICRGQLATRCGWGGLCTAGYSKSEFESLTKPNPQLPGVWLRGVAFSDGSGDSGMFTGVPFVHATCSDAERLEWGGSGGVFGGERGEHFYYEERNRKVSAATKIQALWSGYATRRGPQVTSVCDGHEQCQELIATSTGKQFCCGDYCEVAQDYADWHAECEGDNYDELAYLQQENDDLRHQLKQVEESYEDFRLTARQTCNTFEPPPRQHCNYSRRWHSHSVPKRAAIFKSKYIDVRRGQIALSALVYGCHCGDRDGDCWRCYTRGKACYNI